MRVRRPAALWRDNRTTTLMEFAIVGPLFMILLLLIFEVAYDQFEREVLESTLDYTAHEDAVGSYQGVLSGSAFVSSDFCSNDYGLLNCNNVYVRVQEFVPSQSCYDLYQETTGTLPVAQSGGKWSLQLANFVSASGTGTGGVATAAGDSCITTNSATGFCNAEPSELVIMTAIYVVPSFVTALMPAAYTYTYNGHYVRAPFASEAFYTEPYTASSTAGTQC